MSKLIKNYVKLRIKEKKTFDQQIKLLEAQFSDKQIESQTFERLKDVLESQYYQKQEEQWVDVENKFQNPLNS